MPAQVSPDGGAITRDGDAQHVAAEATQRLRESRARAIAGLGGWMSLACFAARPFRSDKRARERCGETLRESRCQRSPRREQEVPRLQRPSGPVQLLAWRNTGRDGTRDCAGTGEESNGATFDAWPAHLFAIGDEHRKTPGYQQRPDFEGPASGKGNSHRARYCAEQLTDALLRRMATSINTRHHRIRRRRRSTSTAPQRLRQGRQPQLSRQVVPLGSL